MEKRNYSLSSILLYVKDIYKKAFRENRRNMGNHVDISHLIGIRLKQLKIPQVVRKIIMKDMWDYLRKNRKEYKFINPNLHKNSYWKLSLFVYNEETVIIKFKFLLKYIEQCKKSTTIITVQ